MMDTTVWSQAKAIMGSMVVAESDGEFAGLAALLEDLCPFVPDADVDGVEWSFSEGLQRLWLTRVLYRNFVAGTLGDHKLRQQHGDLVLCSFTMGLPDGGSAEVRVILQKAHYRGPMVVSLVAVHRVDAPVMVLTVAGEDLFGETFSGLVDMLVGMYVS